MGMRPRNFQQQIKTQFKSQNEIQKDLTNVPSFQYRICPFKIILGATNSTEAGYKPPTSVPNDYTSFSKIFTGREAILAVWNNSFDLIEPDLKTYDSVGKKNLKIGDVFYGFVQSDQLGIAYSASPANGAFIQEQAIKNVVIRIPNKDKNFDFINNILSNMYCLYMIPEINAVKNKDNYSADRQWYFLETATKCYNNDKELGYIDCTFSSLNDKLATSGMAINQYVQVSAPGEPVAIPGLDLNKNIILDPDYLTPRPVTHAQVTFYGTVGTIAIGLWGRRIDINDGQTITMNPTHLIFPMNYQASTYDPVSFSALPETNYVLTVGAQSTVDTYQQWQQDVAPLYDDGATKNFEGHILTDVDKTTATNPANRQYLPYWDDNFLNNVTIDTKLFDVVGNPYFNYLNTNTKQIVGNTDGFNVNNVKFKNLTNLNAIMYFIFNSINEIPMSGRETTKIQASTIPVFGSFFNVFTGGLDIGFKISSDLIIPRFPIVNFLMSAELYRFYTTVFYSKATDKNIMPYDVFRNGTPDSIGAILGTTSHMTSFTFNLTDSINLSNYDIQSREVIKTGYKELTNLSQIDPENDNQIQLLPKNESDFSLKFPDFLKTNNKGFYIDMIDILVQGKCNFKITFYSMPDNYTGAISDDYSIWSGTYQTVGKASSNTRLIKNTFVLANNTYNFKNKYRYPKAVIPTPPSKIKNTIFIDLSNQFIYGIANNIKSQLPEYDYVEMRPFTTESDSKSKYYNQVIIDIRDYGYRSFSNLKEDYKSLTFNFNFTVDAGYRLGTWGKDLTNNKTYSTPITINLDDINLIQNANKSTIFASSEKHYDNDSGDHTDSDGNWVFNINNYNESVNPWQKASLVQTSQLNNIYVNNLIFTNDIPSSGYTLPSSVWFKLTTFMIDNYTIKIEYQFIATFGMGGSTSNNNARWNLQTKSILINPKRES